MEAASLFKKTTKSLKTVAVILAVSSGSPDLPGFSEAYAQEDPFDRFPFVITCENKGTQLAYYLSRVTQDGTATYLAADRLAGTITLDGHAQAVGDSEGGTCLGKTLEQLRASGQAHDLKP